MGNPSHCKRSVDYSTTHTTTTLPLCMGKLRAPARTPTSRGQGRNQTPQARRIVPRLDNGSLGEICWKSQHPLQVLCIKPTARPDLGLLVLFQGLPRQYIRGPVARRTEPRRVFWKRGHVGLQGGPQGRGPEADPAVQAKPPVGRTRLHPTVSTRSVM